MNKGILRFCLLASASVIAATSSFAATFTLTDTNTSATIDTSNNIGVSDWSIGGIDNVFSNTYLWRIGDSGTADAVQNLVEISSGLTGTRLLDVSYRDAASTFRINLSYLLTGAGDGADLAEVARVTNTSNSAISFRLFQYNDFDLNGTNADDTALRLNSSQMKMSDGVQSLNIVNQGATPIPTYSQLGSLFYSSMTGVSGYNLDTAAGSGIGQSYTGDAAYGFQWNVVINPGETFVMSTDKIAAVPEPGTMVALGLGAIALLKRRRKA